jgi:hypothetical protein
VPSFDDVLQDDIGNAIVATIAGLQTTIFDMIDVSDDVAGMPGPRVEYGIEPVRYPPAQLGRCLVEPELSQPVAGEGLYAGSAMTDFPFALHFEGKDIQGRDGLRQRVADGINGVFGDGGKQWLANFTDTAGNNLGGGGLLTVGQILFGDETPDDLYVVRAFLNVRMMVRTPRLAPP